MVKHVYRGPTALNYDLSIEIMDPHHLHILFPYLQKCRKIHMKNVGKNGQNLHTRFHGALEESYTLKNCT